MRHRPANITLTTLRADRTQEQREVIRSNFERLLKLLPDVRRDLEMYQDSPLRTMDLINFVSYSISIFPYNEGCLTPHSLVNVSR